MPSLRVHAGADMIDMDTIDEDDKTTRMLALQAPQVRTCLYSGFSAALSMNQEMSIQFVSVRTELSLARGSISDSGS